MAVDIKTLRIGSHINYNGKRVRVEQLSTLRMTDAPLEIGVSHDGAWVECVSEDELAPIPLTPELLKELGFELRGRHYIKRISDLCIGMSFKVETWHAGANDSHCSYGHVKFLRYLHELEAFLYLTTQTELIKD